MIIAASAPNSAARLAESFCRRRSRARMAAFVVSTANAYGRTSMAAKKNRRDETEFAIEHLPRDAVHQPGGCEHGENGRDPQSNLAGAQHLRGEPEDVEVHRERNVLASPDLRKASADFPMTCTLIR